MLAPHCTGLHTALTYNVDTAFSAAHSRHKGIDLCHMQWHIASTRCHRPEVTKHVGAKWLEMRFHSNTRAVLATGIQLLNSSPVQHGSYNCPLNIPTRKLVQAMETCTYFARCSQQDFIKFSHSFLQSFEHRFLLGEFYLHRAYNFEICCSPQPHIYMCDRSICGVLLFFFI